MDATPDKAAVTPDAANAGNDGGDAGSKPHIPTMAEIENFRCDCLIDKVFEGGWLAAWRVVLATIEGVKEITGCCVCINQIDLRLTVRIWGMWTLISAALGIIQFVLPMLDISFIWFIYYAGFYVVWTWMGYLLWMGASFNDADKIAIALNVQGWMIILSLGMGLFFVLTTGADFGGYIVNGIVMSCLYMFYASHIVKYLDIIDGKATKSDNLDPDTLNADWKADAEKLHFTGCCCGGGSAPNVGSV